MSRNVLDRDICGRHHRALRVRSAYAAGKLSIGFRDYWVPGANKTSTDLVNDWAEGKVEVQIDYITSRGNKLLLTIAAEGQAKSSHDILAMAIWWPHTNAEMDPIIKQNGDVSDTAKYLGQANGKWFGVPTCNNQIKGPCSRIDLMKKYANIACRRCIRRAARRKLTTGRWTTS